MTQTVDDPSRRLLVAALGAGLVLPFTAGKAQAQGIFGGRPGRLAQGQSIYRLEGSASVNGATANLQTPVRPGDTVETGANSEMIFVVGAQAFLLRGDSRLVLQSDVKEPGSMVITALRLLTGKLLSVSRNASMTVNTPTATIGIRGTGWYAEAEPDLTYFCTCYGTTDIGSANDPDSRQTVVATRHDRPVYILGEATAGRGIREAPFINHSDLELLLIETLVGRTPPFVFPRNDYTAPRRGY